MGMKSKVNEMLLKKYQDIEKYKDIIKALILELDEFDAAMLKQACVLHFRYMRPPPL